MESKRRGLQSQETEATVVGKYHFLVVKRKKETIMVLQIIKEKQKIREMSSPVTLQNKCTIDSRYCTSV